MPWWPLLISLTAAMLACTPSQFQSTEGEHTKDSGETIRQNLRDGKAVILDVRSREEWDAGHVKGALFRPIKEMQELDEEVKSIEGVAKDKIVYTYCRAGRRALRAGAILKEMGYDVRPIKSGCAELLENGFEKSVEPPKKR